MSAGVDLRQLAIERGSPSGPRRRRHWLTRYVLPGVLVAGFLSLVAWASRDLVFPPQPVTVTPVRTSLRLTQRAGTALFNTAGWIEPRPTPVRVAALAPGVVEELLVVEDEKLQRGQAIARLVARDAELTVESAAANLRLAQADLQQEQAKLVAAKTRFEQPVHLEAALAEAATQLATLETEIKNLPFARRRSTARLVLAQQNYDRKSSLQDAVSGREVDEAKSELDAAQALVDELALRGESLEKQRTAITNRHDALAKQLELLADEIQARDTALALVQSAEARVALAQVMLDEAQLRLDRMTVRAPVDGRVYQLIGLPGTTLSGSMARGDTADASTVITMYRPEMLQVRADVRFEDIPKVQLGQPVQINNPALRSPLVGRVLFISSEANIQKNTLEVKVALDEPSPVFKPEMLVDVTFLAPPQESEVEGNEEELRIYVPQSQIHSGEAGNFVWVADQRGAMARRTLVELGDADGEGFVEVRSGLNAASRLIASGHQSLIDGQRIRITGEE